ncbi:triple tyrosine motif-containing protein [Christiangramia echinicola]|uniref:triple tyrosine motif-containing protein n=1 Tax=Christiangramia echinicola TaxID=279359 RepID=UPI000427A69B|nr:triple tyrosine motif-containing protein [Christiangramia echinicola]
MGHFKFIILFTVFIIFGITGKVIGQNTNSVKRVKAVEPFIKAEEVHIQQGYGDDLWITTPVKVIRYNSIELEDYNKFRGIPKEVGKEYRATYTDSKNQTWLSGNLGIAVFDSRKDEFEFVSATTGAIYGMKEDAGNQLWIAAENGIFKLKVDSDKPDFELSRFISENTLAADIILFQNKIIFGGPNGLLTIDRRSGKFNKIDMGFYQDLQISSLLAMENSILIGTMNRGLYTLTSDLKIFKRVSTIPWAAAQKEISEIERFENEIIVATKGAGLLRLKEDLSLIDDYLTYPDNIFQLHLNDQNLLWLVSNDGLYLQNYSGYVVNKLKNDITKYSSLADDYVTAAKQDSKGNIWFGTGKGLSIWNPTTDRWRHMKNLNYNRVMTKPDEITDFASIGEHMWVATADDGVYKININTLLRAHYSVNALNKIKIQSITSLFADADNNIWVGGKDGYLTRISSNNQIKEYPIRDVQSIAELGPKKVIVATKSRVHSLDPYSGRIIDLKKLTANEELLYYSMNEVKITREGLGLFATNGAGLLMYDFESEEVRILSEEDGLPSNNITGLELDSEDGYWLASDKGLAFYEPGINEVKVFSELNGLTTNELTSNFARLKDGSLVLGSTNGVNVFKPKTMLAQQEFKPRLELKNLFLPKEKDADKGNIALESKTKVSLDEDSGFRISFAAISHLDPDSIQYSWKLERVDKDWTKPSPLTAANYSNLAPGVYTFKVRSKLAGSAWSKPQSLTINVQAVGGTVSSVYLFMGVSILAMVGIFIVVFIKRSKSADREARAELREQLKKEFKQPVESAVKSLSKISAGAEQGNTEDLQRFAARFDDLFNQILNFNYQGSVYEISKIDLHKHIKQMVKDIEPIYKMKDLEVIVNDQWGDSEFYYNREMLDKVFYSLISGSTGYSLKNGKLIVNIIETSVGDLKIQITDNGRGIPENDIKVLEKKRSLNNGPGIRDRSGLRYIIKAKELLASTGGSFSYETEKNEGSTFTAVLKSKKEDYRKIPERAANILKAQTTKSSQKEDAPANNNLSESKILIIENDNKTRELLVNSIGKYCQIYQAVNAEEGMEKAGMIFPDIIVSATVLPDMNAIQLSKMLKSNIGLNHINIFLMAEVSQIFDEIQLDETTEVINKPIDINQLLDRINKILGWQKDLRDSYVKAHVEHAEVKFRSKKDEKFILALTDLVIQNIKNENFSVHELSAAVGISSNSLFMKLKSIVNLSPQDFMEFTRLNYARDLTEHTDMNVMEIAYKSGFSSPKLFYSSFKKFFGYGLAESMQDKP